jgi:hypothetical protein
MKTYRENIIVKIYLVMQRFDDGPTYVMSAWRNKQDADAVALHMVNEIEASGYHSFVWDVDQWYSLEYGGVTIKVDEWEVQ